MYNTIPTIPVQTWRSVDFRGTHSLAQTFNMGSMTVELLPALQDNYMYLVSKSALIAG